MSTSVQKISTAKSISNIVESIKINAKKREASNKVISALKIAIKKHKKEMNKAKKGLHHAAIVKEFIDITGVKEDVATVETYTVIKEFGNIAGLKEALEIVKKYAI